MEWNGYHVNTNANASATPSSTENRSTIAIISNKPLLILLSIMRRIAIGKFNDHMAPIAEGLVGGGATSTESNAVANFVSTAVR